MVSANPSTSHIQFYLAIFSPLLLHGCEQLPLQLCDGLHLDRVLVQLWPLPPQERVGGSLVPGQTLVMQGRLCDSASCSLAWGEHVLEDRIGQVLQGTKGLFNRLALILRTTKPAVASRKIGA